MNPTWIAALLALSLLAGCAQRAPDGTETTTDGAPPATSSAEEPLAAQPPPAEGVQLDVKSTLELRTRATAEGSLASFAYTIPKGALVERHIGSFTFTNLAFQVAPLVSDAVLDGLKQWGFLVFQENDGAADLRATYVGSAGTGTSGIGPLATAQEYEPRLEPTVLSLGGSDLKVGDRRGCGLAARGDTPGDVAFALRALDHPIDFDTDIPKDAASLGPRVALPPLATGTGFQLAQYLQFTSLFAFVGESATPYANVVDTLPRNDIGATVRDVTINAPGFDGGYTYAVGTYFGYEAHGVWSATGELHGLKVGDRSLIAMDTAVFPLFLPELLLVGLPIYVYQAEGAGASDLAYHVQVANVNEFQFLIYSKLDLGAGLEKLMGVPALSGGSAFTGLAGNIPPMVVAHGRHVEVFAGGGVLNFDLPDA